MSKNLKLWKCVGAIGVKEQCNNSIVATNDDERLSKHGDQWVKLYWDKEKRYLPNLRSFTCDTCTNKSEQWEKKLQTNMMIEMAKVFNN